MDSSLSHNALLSLAGPEAALNSQPQFTAPEGDQCPQTGRGMERLKEVVLCTHWLLLPEPLIASGSIQMLKHLGGLWKNVPWQKRMDLEMLVPGILLLPSGTGRDRLVQLFFSRHTGTAISRRAMLAFTHCAAGVLAGKCVFPSGLSRYTGPSFHSSAAHPSKNSCPWHKAACKAASQ